MRKARWMQVAFWAGIILAIGPTNASAGEFYYLMIFGSQSTPKQLRYTHTWATMIKAVGEGPDPDNYTLEYNTISWLPQTLEVKVWRLWPEPGVNLDLYRTIDAMLANHESITMWGPFFVRKELYEKSLRVQQIIASGAPRYRAIDGPANLLISDCIHAVAAVDPEFGRGHYPLIRIGKPASRFLARQVMVRSIYDQWAYDNSWLIPRFALDRYPIEVVPPQHIPKRSCFLCTCPD
ncbi:MAG TPA: hypothetical protein VGZ22_31000 [Isosphaeraceae bacterium]|jgi:hypothetical protein|nr:hypothetical protein [Isosphaeraceae bacterium]